MFEWVFLKTILNDYVWPNLFKSIEFAKMLPRGPDKPLAFFSQLFCVVWCLRLNNFQTFFIPDEECFHFTLLPATHCEYWVMYSVVETFDQNCSFHLNVHYECIRTYTIHTYICGANIRKKRSQQILMAFFNLFPSAMWWRWWMWEWIIGWWWSNFREISSILLLLFQPVFQTSFNCLSDWQLHFQKFWNFYRFEFCSEVWRIHFSIVFRCVSYDFESEVGRIRNLIQISSRQLFPNVRPQRKGMSRSKQVWIVETKWRIEFGIIYERRKSLCHKNTWSRRLASKGWS